MDATIFNPRNRWNSKKLARAIVDEASAIRWCQEQNLLPSIKFCQRGHQMDPTPRSKGFPQFRCRKDGCKEESSVAAGTWFERTNLPVDKVIR